METRALTERDHDLIAAATELLEAHYEPGRHEVTSALRTASGEVYAAINLVTSVGTASVHCEPITVANAVMDGETSFDTTVAVTYADPSKRSEIQVLSACGVCRELLCDFDSDLDVVVPADPEPVKASVTDLLPGKL